MWTSQQATALKIGLTLADYWGDITPKTVDLYATAYQEKINDQAMVLDSTNHILGGYIRIAIGDALSGKNQYPKEPVTAKREEPHLRKVFTKEETEAFLKERQEERAKAQ